MTEAARVVLVTGTSDPVEIAVALAALQTRAPENPAPSGYDRWRAERLAALRVSRKGSSRPGI